MNPLQTLKKVLALSWEETLWLLIFLAGSLLLVLVLTIIPMRKLAGLMGHHLNNRAVCMLANERDVRKAIRIGQLAQMVDNATPWQFPCLAQALCVKWLLNRYRIPSVFYLGTMIVKQEAKPEMKAHAWVDVRQHTVVGAPQHKQYTPVASFVTPEPI